LASIKTILASNVNFITIFIMKIILVCTKKKFPFISYLTPTCMHVLIVGTAVQEVLEEATKVTSNVGSCSQELVRINQYWKTNFL
jgi:uncharacterized membrane protein YdcZ (DUF606 family)